MVLTQKQKKKTINAKKTTLFTTPPSPSQRHRSLMTNFCGLKTVGRNVRYIFLSCLLKRPFIGMRKKTNNMGYYKPWQQHQYQQRLIVSLHAI